MSSKSVDLDTLRDDIDQLRTDVTKLVTALGHDLAGGAGKRASRLSRLFWNVYYTNYFYRKYYDRYAARAGLKVPCPLAMAAFALYQVYVLFIRPAGKLGERLADRLHASPRQPPAVASH